MQLTGLFITGTDTGVGKTFVTSAIARRLTARRWQVAAVKPAESGCEEGPNGLIAADAEAIAVAAGDWQPQNARCLYRMRAALAPGVAARAEGVAVDLSVCAAFVASAAARADLVLVEGAGGWRVPLDRGDGTIADLAKRLQLPVVIVGRGGLGTINHSVLTAETVQRDGCTVGAIVLSVRPDEDLQAANANAAEIARMVPGARVAVMRTASDLDALLDHFTWNAR